MSSKYETGSSRLLADDVALTDHAMVRYRQRTPHDCDVDPHTAWQRGEDIKHPQVAQSDGEDVAPDRVRVYKHSQEWGVAFLISEREQARYGRQPSAVMTVINFQGFDHGPSRAYLHSHGPHNEVDG